MEIRSTIKKPCPENWETMKIGLHSRFCDNCQKNVIDFTNRNRKEILQFLLANHDKRICGRIYPSQTDFTHSDLIVTINALTRQHKDSNLPFYLLTIGTILLMSCNSPTTEKSKITTSDTLVVQQDTTIDQPTIASQTDTIQKNQKEEKFVEIPELPILGEITFVPDTAFGRTTPYPYVEVMPEFKGGIDSLMSFLRQNLKYPDWEKENKIQGKVFVNFVVDKNGKIKEARILKSVKGAKNFDTEVLRVVNSMPDWIPGQLNGKNVDVEFNLPVNFKL